MSGLAVWWRTDGAPVDPARVEALAAAIRYRGPDRTTVTIDGSVAIVHCALDTTPEAVGERQPATSPESGLQLVADARIDNRPELARALAHAHPQRRLHTDAEYLLAAYERWGTGLVDHIRGDFGFVVVDAARRRLFAARDHFGIRPLFWARDGADIVVASTLRAVADHLGHPLELDDQHLIELLAVSPDDQSRTAFAAVRRLPPAHTLEVDHHGAVLPRRYWSFEDFARPPLPDADAPDALREALEGAVRVRLRSATPVFSHASGGLDSSTVYGLARTLQAAEGGPAVRAYANYYPGDPDADERPYIEAVDHRWGDVEQVDGVAPSYDYEAAARRFLEPFTSGDLAGLSAGFELVARSGSRVLLTGVMGDQTLKGRATAVPDLWAHAGVRSLWSARDHFLDPGSSWPRTAMTLTRPVLGRLLRRTAVGRRRAAARRTRWLEHEHLTREAADRLAEAPVDRLDEGPPWAQSQRARFASVTEVRYRPVFDNLDRHAALAGIEARHPLSDVEFAATAAAVPEYLYLDGGDGRALHRRLFGDVLPEAVSGRRDKAETSAMYLRAMHSGWRSHPWDPIALIDRGWVDGVAWRRLYDRFATAPRASGLLWPVWFTFTVERWLRMYEEGSPD